MQALAGTANLARSAQVAIVFALQRTIEGKDLANLSLPDKQDELIATIAAANPRTVAVLESGTAVKMPWLAGVAAVLEAWVPGIRGGEGITNVLSGRVNFPGKLAVTFPKSHPSGPAAPGGPACAARPPGMGPMIAGGPPRMRVYTRQLDLGYSEGARAGHRGFQSRKREPRLLYGLGLSETTFADSDLCVDAAKREVTFTLRNTGQREDAEAAQAYVELPASAGRGSGG